ncbi:adenylyltransferase and sulfurtransferase MOCS3 [Hemicordylus capensis]|uniref:adenylyltransferase and sulfurtransferase MOCS3 n=1 Tax=Hemicordylus capensis TaxID=884348 RepID=UPI002303BAA0|nr:adenylyltransferase and sulfurtransferase MOCS3 [Hemicordylus capensis]
MMMAAAEAELGRGLRRGGAGFAPHSRGLPSAAEAEEARLRPPLPSSRLLSVPRVPTFCPPAAEAMATGGAAAGLPSQERPFEAAPPEAIPPLPPRAALSRPEIQRYSRQLVLPELGVRGQLRLSGCSVLVVGCGGLGCPLAQYLAAAGVGRLGLVDHDVVELSNLHRQVLHRESRLGTSKAGSAAAALRELNSGVQCVPYEAALSPATALELVRAYDLVADCSDNVPTRYLVNDACVLAGKPLVSGSALRLEGQLAVYNYQGGPCYRCLFPKPPPPETVTNCADGGVLGVVPGILGSLQALEVLKIASGMGTPFNRSMLLFDALDGSFRRIKLRPRDPDCALCGDHPTLTALQDYEAFCGSSATDKCRTLHLLHSDERISVEEYKQIRDRQVPHILIDVRPPVETDICCLPQALHVPLPKLEGKDEECLKSLGQRIQEAKQRTNGNEAFPVYVICKLGNDSQKAVRILQGWSDNGLGLISIKDIRGGLMAWANKIDQEFPQY